MSVSNVIGPLEHPFLAAGIEPPRWYGLHTRPRHEKVVANRIEAKGINTFLPLVKEVHRWSDRNKTVEVPLFSCYVFARMTPDRLDRLRVLQVEGVFGLVGSRGEGTSIPDEQIDAVRSLLSTALPWSSHPFLKIGQRVRIRSGALSGVEGTLLSHNGDRTLVISVDALQRSLVPASSRRNAARPVTWNLQTFCAVTLS